MLSLNVLLLPSAVNTVTISECGPSPIILRAETLTSYGTYGGESMMYSTYRLASNETSLYF